MKTFLDCVPCFLKQALDASRMVTDDSSVHDRVLRKVLEETRRFSFAQPPPYMGREIHRIIRNETQSTDPYRHIKEHFNEFTLSLLPELRGRIDSSPDPFETAARLAIAGNIIDFALTNPLDDERVLRTIEEVLQQPLAINHLGAMREAIAEAEDILYLADNAGEVGFDRLLIERMPVEKVTVVVKESPVINDATLEDARAVGLTAMVTVMTNGSDAPGTILETCSKEFRERFDKASVIVVKGQGNYETLNDMEKPMFFLLKAKCPVIARDLGCKVGDIVVAWSPARVAEQATPFERR